MRNTGGGTANTAGVQVLAPPSEDRLVAQFHVAGREIRRQQGLQRMYVRRLRTVATVRRTADLTGLSPATVSRWGKA